MAIIDDIREIRERKKISRRTIAEKLYMAEATYRDIEYGKIRLTLENYIEICKILNISPMEYLRSNDNEHFVLLNDRDIADLNRIINKINSQAFTINNSGNDVSINVNNNYNDKKWVYWYNNETIQVKK